MFVAPVDATRGESEWRAFVESHPFGHLVAPGGPDRELPVVVPTQFVLAGRTVWLHLVRANPIFDALAENRRVVLSVADDWAFIPSSWKAIGDEDPELGIPTTYYGAVQLAGIATVHDERTAPGHVAAILRRQLAAFQPGIGVADPVEAHAAKLLGILGIEIRVEQVIAKFKYGGNVDQEHRRAVVERLRSRGQVGDEAAALHVMRRLGDGVDDRAEEGTVGRPGT
jgi:transcriptional regulator